MKFKKLFLALICVVVAACSLVFVGCGKKHYNLKNLVADYSNGQFSNLTYDGGRYVFNFGETLTNDVYAQELNEIQTINNNLTSFIAQNISYSVEKQNDGVGGSNRDKAEKYVKAVKSSLKKADTALDEFRFMTSVNQDLSNEERRQNLQIYFNSFNAEVYNYFVAMCNLSSVYSYIYFGNYLKNINTNYYAQYTNGTINVEELSNRYLYNARVEYQIFNTSQIYLIENWNQTSTFNADNFAAYQAELEALNLSKLAPNQSFAAGEQTNLLAVQMYNSIALLTNDYKNFESARDVILNGVNNNYMDDNYIIVKNYKQKVYAFNSVLKALIVQAQ